MMKRILLLIFIISLSACSDTPRKITFETFENEIVLNEEVKKVLILNDKEVLIFISVHPGPYKNKRRIADYVIPVQNLKELDSNLEKLTQQTKNKNLQPEYWRTNNLAANFFVTFLPFSLVLFIFGIFVLWVLTIIRIVKSDKLEANEKVFWIIFVIVFPIVGTIIFYLMKKW